MAGTNCQISKILEQLAGLGIALDSINLGGGFPTNCGDNKAPDISIHRSIIKAALILHFGDKMPPVIAEPGRALVGDAGIIVSDIILVSQKR